MFLQNIIGVLEKVLLVSSIATPWNPGKGIKAEHMASRIQKKVVSARGKFDSTSGRDFNPITFSAMLIMVFWV